jgi:hypothetical protein
MIALAVSHNFSTATMSPSPRALLSTRTAEDLVSDCCDGFLPMEARFSELALLVETLLHEIRHDPHCSRPGRVDGNLELPMSLLFHAVSRSQFAKEHALAMGAQHAIVEAMEAELRKHEGVTERKAASRSLGRFSVSCGKAQLLSAILIAHSFGALTQFTNNCTYDGFGIEQLGILLRARAAFPHMQVIRDFADAALLTICSGTHSAAKERRRVAVEAGVPAAITTRGDLPEGMTAKEKRAWVEIADPLRELFRLM